MKNHILIILTIWIFSACGSYKTVYVEPKEFLENEVVKNNFNRYSIIVHDKDGISYQLENASIAGDSILGKITPIVIDSSINEKSIESKEVHLFVKESIDSNQNVKKIGILKEKITTIQTSAKDEASQFTKVGLIILWIVGSLLLLYGTLVLIIYASGKAAESSSDGSDSGCFIATMVYGSYSAPEVIVFRQFRDCQLSKSTSGKKFIQWYYSYSPQFVAKYANKKWAHLLVKTALTPLLCLLKLKYKV